jgi:hypothetical protein
MHSLAKRRLGQESGGEGAVARFAHDRKEDNELEMWRDLCLRNLSSFICPKTCVDVQCFVFSCLLSSQTKWFADTVQVRRPCVPDQWRLLIRS